MRKTSSKLILVISTLALLSSCSLGLKKSNKSSSASETSSKEETSIDEETSINETSVYEESLTESSSEEENKVKQLRNIDNTSHSFNYSLNENPNYLNFKAKLKNLSIKLSEALVKENFDKEKNIAFSPLSIELALGLATYCAANETREELLATFDLDFESFSTYYSCYIDQLSKEIRNSDNELISLLDLINSIWINNGVSLLEEGLDELASNYYCYSYEAPFASSNKIANEALREFIKEKTRGLIDKDLNIDPDTLFVLMNVLYLKDIWNNMGEDLRSIDKYQFTNIDGSISKSALLLGEYKSGKSLVTKEFESFYTSTQAGYKLYFVKPVGDNLIQNVFNQDTLDLVLDHSSYKDEGKKLTKTRCIFPSFTGESDVELKELFVKYFGVERLFDARCDFSNITNSSVNCSKFKHIAKLEVKEKGIEGAAVTYLEMKETATGPDEETYIYEDFVVDKEFGYILTAPTNDIIFSGITTHID